MRTLTEKYTENIGHGLFLNRTSSNHITCNFTVYSLYCHLERIWLYATEICVFLKKNALS